MFDMLIIIKNNNYGVEYHEKQAYCLSFVLLITGYFRSLLNKDE